MRTLTPSEKLSLQVSIALMAGMFSVVPTAYGAPTLNEIKSVTANGAPNNTTVHQSSDKSMTAVMANGNRNNVIDWTDFSVGAKDKVIFDAIDTAGSGYTKTNNYLNTVSGGGTSYINGVMAGGRNVYIVNPNGVIMGKNAVVDVGSLYVSTRDTANVTYNVTDQTSDMSPLQNTATAQADVVNMGRIQADKVSVEAQNIRFLNTGDIHYVAKTDDGSVQYVENRTDGVANPASYTTPTASALATAIDSKPVMNPAQKLGTVTLNGSGYVHVGYDAYDATNATYLNSNPAASKSNPKADTYSPVTLGYTGDGTTPLTKDNAYALVKNATQLQKMNTNLTLNYMLGDDITLSGTFTPIGTGTVAANSSNKTGRAFSGSFDGNYFKVSNLDTSGQYAGLFGSVVGTSSDRAEIMNVGVVNANVLAGTTKAYGYGGGIIGYADYADISDVYNKTGNDVNKAISPASSTISPPGSNGLWSIEAPLSQYGKVGGIVGYASHSTINSVYNSGNVWAGAGIVGEIANGTTVSNAYNTGTISNFDYRNNALVPHYAIVDTITNGTVKNVYGAGELITLNGAGVNQTSYMNNLAPGAVTNGYIINTSAAAGQQLYATSNGAATGTYKDERVASSYAFFPTGKTISSDDAWRIYDGQSKPLLRNFLKANGQGTVPVSYAFGLYTDKTTKTASATVSGKSSANGVTYNGYYIGPTAIENDSSRNLDTTKIGKNTDPTKRIKNAGESQTFFYVTSQDGYDLASDSITIKQRNLVPSGDIELSKVYDGTADATTEMQKKFGSGSTAVDVAAIYSSGGTVNGVYYPKGTLIETGLVVDGTTGTAETVQLSGNAVSSATYYVQGTNYGTQAINVSQAPNTANAADVKVVFNSAAALNTSIQTDTDSDGTKDYANYHFDPSAFTSGQSKVTGIITPRPVYVSLQEKTGIDKVYDSTAQVVYRGSSGNWSAATDNVQDVSSTAATALGLSDAGLINGTLDKTSTTPYYTTGSGTATVPNAGTGYTANYALKVTGISDPSNYEFYEYTPANATTGTAASTALLNQDASGNYLLTGTGDINKRVVYVNDISVLDSSGKAITNFTKVYDNTADYDDAKSVAFTPGNSVSVADAVAQVTTTGVISGEENNFKFTLNDANFYDQNKQSTDEEITAKYVKFDMTSNGSLANYDLQDNSTSPATSIKVTSGGAISFYRDGTITPRDIYVKLNDTSGIDKVYDDTADLIDTTTRAYSAHTDNNTLGNVTHDTAAATAQGAVDAGGNVYGLVTGAGTANGTNNGTVSDGVTWNIQAAYQNTAGGNTVTTNAQDVYLNNGAASAKDIKYSVSLKGDHADNYVLHVDNGNGGYTSYTQVDTTAAGAQVNAAELDATGTISQRVINGLSFAAVNKVYDGTATVGTVNGTTQADNQIKINGVTVDNTVNATNIDTNTGLMGDDTLEDVFGTTNGSYSNGVYTYTGAGTNGTKMTGEYGTPAVYTPGVTPASFTANKHAYDIGAGTAGDGTTANGADATAGDGKGATRYVQYNNVDTALSQTTVGKNYVLASSLNGTQYGEGRIDSLDIDSLGYHTQKTTKVYDGSAAVVGDGVNDPYTYKVTVDPTTGASTTTPQQLTSAVVSQNIGSMTGTNAAKGVTVNLNYTVNPGSYFVDTSNSNAANANVKNADGIVYELTVSDSGGYGDYSVAATSSDGTYTRTTQGTAVPAGSTSSNTVNITGDGAITSRPIYATPVTRLSKTYDAGTVVKDANGTALSGQDVVAFAGKNYISGLMGTSVDGVENDSTAVYSGDTRSGYSASDVNVYGDNVLTSASGAKKVTYTLGTTTGTNTGIFAGDTSGNYTIYENSSGSYKNYSSPITLSGNDITQANLELSMDNITKVYDTTDYALSGTYNGQNVAVTGTNQQALINKNGKGGFQGTDTANLTTQNTSVYLPTANLAAADVGSHQVKYDLVSDKDLKNYRLVDKNGNQLTYTRNSNGLYDVTVYGDGKITQLTVDSIQAVLDLVSKVYDGSTSVSYVHGGNNTADNAATNTYGGFDSTQQGSGTASSSGLQLGNSTSGTTLNLTASTTGSNGYQVLTDAASSYYGGKDVGTQDVTYTFLLDSNVANNITFANTSGTINGQDSYTWDATNRKLTYTDAGAGTITAKNAYAYLNSTGLNADPTKEYDGNTTVFGIATDGSSSTTPITAATAAGYVGAYGLASGDSIAVAAAYESKDVANSGGSVITQGNTVDYGLKVVDGNNNTSSNYNLFTIDGDGTATGGANVFTYNGTKHLTDLDYFSSGDIYDASASTTSRLTGTTVNGSISNEVKLDTASSTNGATQVLAGQGTITPKGITFDTTKAEKIYDTDADIDMPGSAVITGTTLPTFSLSGLVGSEDLNVSAASGEYGVYNYTGVGSGFTADENVNWSGTAAGAKAVQYKGVTLADGTMGKATNYKLTATATGDLTNSAGYTLDTSTGTGTITYSEYADKGQINRKALSGSATVSYNTITKAYDNSDLVAYDHRAANSTYGTYDSSQGGADAAATKAADFVTGLSIGGTAIGANNYSVSEALSKYGGKDAGTYGMTFVLDMNNSFASNYDLSGVTGMTLNSATNTYSLTDKSATGTITPKHVYAALTNTATTAAPTKVYDGDTAVETNTQATADTNSGRVWTDTELHPYMNVYGLRTDDGSSYSVSAVYDTANAGTNKTVKYTATPSNTTNYEVYTTDGTLVSNNATALDYNTVDATGAASTTANNTLNGTGTIEKNQFTINFNLAQKAYDNGYDIDMDTADTTNGVITPTSGSTAAVTAQGSLPNPTATGLVNGESIALASNAGQLLSGNYGNYAYDSTGQTDGFTADENVNYDATTGTAKYKAVQYKGIANALANSQANGGTADLSNYELVGTATGQDLTNQSGYLYDSVNDTITFSENAEKGRITRRQLQQGDIVADFSSATKEYDTTKNIASALTLNSNGTGSVAFDDGTAKNYFSIHTDPTNVGQRINLDYNLTSAVFQNNGTPTSAVGAGYDMVYEVNGISAVSLQNFVLDPTAAAAWRGTFNSNGYNGQNVTGSITKRIISGSAYDSSNNLLGQQLKTYDGTTAGETLTMDPSGRAQANGKTYFDIDDDDMAVLNLEGKTGLIGVTGTYGDKKANLNPYETVSGGKPVTYEITDANNQLGSNYTIETTKTNGNVASGDNYIGAGDIRQRTVYVMDKGGDVIEKTYNRQTDASTADKATRFVLDRTPIIDSDVDLDLSGLSAKYGVLDAQNNFTADENVTRDSSHNVTQKAVQFTGFALQDTNASGNSSNYYLEAKTDTGYSLQQNRAPVAGTYNVNNAVNSGNHLQNKATITETKGGQINPVQIQADLVNAPTKIYDAGTNIVNGSNAANDRDVNSGDNTANEYANMSNVKLAAAQSAAAQNASVVTGVLNRNNAGKANMVKTLTVDLDGNTATTGDQEGVDFELISATYDNPNVRDNDRTQGNELTSGATDGTVNYVMQVADGNYELTDANGTVLTPTYSNGAYTYTLVEDNDPNTAVGTGKGGIITPRTLTGITAAPASKTYDGSADVNSVGAGTAAALINSPDLQGGETFADIAGVPVYDASGNLVSGVTGTYLSTDGSRPDPNAAAAESSGGDLIRHQMQYQIALNDEKGSNYQFDSQGTGNAVTNEDTYSLTGTDADTGTINRKQLTISTNSTSVWRGTQPSLTGRVTGFVGSDSAQGISYHAAGDDTSSLGSRSIYGWYRNQAGEQMRYGSYTYYTTDGQGSKVPHQVQEGWYPYTGSSDLMYGTYTDNTGNSVTGWYSTGTGTRTVTYTGYVPTGGTAVDGLGNIVTIDYNATTGTYSYTDANNNTVSLTLDINGDLTDGTSTYTGYVVTRGTAAGGSNPVNIAVSYDGSGNPIYTDASGNVLTLSGSNLSYDESYTTYRNYTSMDTDGEPDYANYGQNYYLTQNPGTLTVRSKPSGGGGGGSSSGGSSGGPIIPTPTHTPIITPMPTQTPAITPMPSVTPTVTSTPSVTSTVTPTPSVTPAVTSTPTTTPVTETETVTPVVPTVTTDEVVPKSIIPNTSAYNQVSHDFNNDVNRNANAAIAYTDTSGNPVEISGKGVESELANTVTTADVDAETGVQQSDASKSTIAINTSDVVNLLGEDVVSNGSIGLSSGTGTSGTNVTTTEDGYLSVSTDKALTADSQAAIENSDGTTNLSGAADSEAAIENSNGTTNLSNATDSQAAIESSNGTTNLIGAIGSEGEEETAEAVAMNAAAGSSKTRDGQDSELSQDEQDAQYKSGEASIEYSAGLSEATDEDEDEDEEENRRKREQRSEEEEQQDSQAEIQYKNAVA